MTDQPGPPPEPDGGQDTEPPDLLLALVVAVLLLRDLADRLDPELPNASDDKDLRDRIGAVLTVLTRLRRRIAEERENGR